LKIALFSELAQRRAELSIVTQPPILTHASVPGTLTKPGPKALHALARAACDFASFDGGDHLDDGGSAKLCASAAEAGTANSNAAAIA
jgi:hypothetical protein